MAWMQSTALAITTLYGQGMIARLGCWLHCWSCKENKSVASENLFFYFFNKDKKRKRTVCLTNNKMGSAHREMHQR